MICRGRNFRFLLVWSCVGVVLLATPGRVSGELSIAGAEQQFYYVNNVKHNGWTHLSYEIACLEPGGCLNISVVSQSLLQACGDCRNITGNLGCYESQPDASRNFKTVQALNFSEHTSLPTLDMTEGSIVCSSGQLSVFVSVDIPKGLTGGPGQNEFELAAWHSAGRRFAKAVSRSEDDCHIYSLQATTVRITTYNDISSIPVVAYVSIEAFGLTTFQSIHERSGASTFQSEDEVHISCSTSDAADFSQLTEVDNVVYGAESTVLTAIGVHCDSLEVAAVSSLSCGSSIETQRPTTISAYSNGVAAEVDTGNVRIYRGPGVRCESSEGNVCLSMYTYADGDGGEATVSLPVKRHAKVFVLPVESRNIVLIGEERGLCKIRHTSWAFEQVVGINGIVDGEVFNGYFELAILPAGTIVECNQKYMAIAQTRVPTKEFNLQGYIEDFVVAPPEPATSFPTVSPTNGSLTEEIDNGNNNGNNNEDDSLVIILSSSLAVLGSLALLAWKYDARRFIFRQVDEQADIPRQYGSYLPREEIPEAVRTVRNEDSTRTLPVAEVFL